MILVRIFPKLWMPSIPKWQKRAAMQSSLKANCENKRADSLPWSVSLHKSIYGEFLKAPNKKIFRQAHSDKLAQYEEALQILEQHSPDGKFPTMKDLRAEKEQLTIQKDAQYDTYRYFKDYHKELQTVCANVDSILGTEQEVQQHEQQHTRKYEPSL